MTGSLALPRRLEPGVVFGLLVLGTVAAEWQVVHRVQFWRQPALGSGVAFDLLVWLPGLFYWLIVRRYKLPLSTLLGMLAASVALCQWLLPGVDLPLLAGLRWVLLGAELLTLGYTAWRLRQLVRTYRASRQQATHVVESLFAACQATLGRIGPLLATEAAVVRYAVAGFWARPEVGAGEVAFSTYQQSGFVALLATLGGLTVVESAAVHLVLARWWPGIALGLTIASLYMLLWLLAHGQAVRCRPVLLTPTALVVRVGFCWRTTILRSQLLKAQVLTGDLPASAAGCLHLAAPLLVSPNLLLYVAEPQPVLGLFGRRRTSCCLACYVDEPQALVQQLAGTGA